MRLCCEVKPRDQPMFKQLLEHLTDSHEMKDKGMVPIYLYFIVVQWNANTCISMYLHMHCRNVLCALHVVFVKKVYMETWPTTGIASEHKCSLPFDLQCGHDN